MNVSIKLYGVFRIDRFKEKFLEYPDGSRALDIIEDLDIPQNLLGFILINGVHATIEDCLKDGDSLMVLPLLEGG